VDEVTVVMTFGVDECLRCGKAMRARRDNTKADDVRPSRMSAAEWRKAGWLAQPTRAQLRYPSTACCAACTQAILRRKWKPGLRVVGMFAAIVVFGAICFWLAEIYVP
jgi:hypothetical protein